MIEIITSSVQETLQWGERIGKALSPGDILCLDGDLGAGKTALTGGIAKGLGITEHITSPTFTIVSQYDGTIPLYHFDVYRVADPDEILAIGFEEYLDDIGVVVIEWAELIREILPKDYLHIELLHVTGENTNQRKIRISFAGDRYEHWEQKLHANEGGV